MDALEELRYLLLAAQREGARSLAALLKPLGLTPAQAEVLTVLREAGRDLTVREIGDRLVCEGGSPSRLVSTLVDAGLLARRRHPRDARAVALRLTAGGRRKAAQVAEAEARLHAWLGAALTDRQVDATARVLRTLVAGRPGGDAIARRRDDA